MASWRSGYIRHPLRLVSLSSLSGKYPVTLITTAINCHALNNDVICYYAFSHYAFNSRLAF